MVIAFLIGAWLIEAKLSAPVSPEGQVTATSTSPASTAASTLVAVHDQKAGAAVTVDSVSVPAPGVWVAVREMQGNDLGNVLGAARVLGPATNVSIPLLRSTVPGTTYAVLLYRDDGDGVFDYQKDSVYVDFSTGERVVALFTTDL